MVTKIGHVLVLAILYTLQWKKVHINAKIC